MHGQDKHSAGIIGVSISSISIGITGISHDQPPPQPHQPPQPGSHHGSQTWKFQVDVVLPLAFITDHVHCLHGQSQGILFANENLDVSIPLQ